MNSTKIESSLSVIEKSIWLKLIWTQIQINMKTFLYFFILISYIIISSRANATIIIVNNTTNSPGQYTTLQAAVDAATDGDTLHIEPSNFAYDNNNEQGAIYITKSLTIIGIGHKPNKEFSFPSHIGALRLSGNATSIGTKLMG